MPAQTRREAKRGRRAAEVVAPVDVGAYGNDDGSERVVRVGAVTMVRPELVARQLGTRARVEWAREQTDAGGDDHDDVALYGQAFRRDADGALVSCGGLLVRLPDPTVDVGEWIDVRCRAVL